MGDHVLYGSHKPGDSVFAKLQEMETEMPAVLGSWGDPDSDFGHEKEKGIHRVQGADTPGLNHREEMVAEFEPARYMHRMVERLE